MALVLADRVRETTTTTGTGSVTLAGAYTGFQTFSAAIGNTNSTYYTIANVGSGEWEVGIGTYSSGGNLLSRTTVLSSSNGGSLVNFGAGAKDVFVTQPAERALYVASAGTGLESQVTAFTNGGIVYASSTSALATGSALTFDGTTLTGTQATAAQISLNNSSGNYLFLTGAGGNSFIDNRVSGGAITFRNGGAFTWSTYGGSDRMTLDSSGNLGLGVTPSAWASFTSMDVSTGGAALTSSGQNCYLTTNAYYNAGWKYKLTSIYGVSWYEQFNGQHAWFSAPSGTAGNAISATQAMTLDASGNLLVGTTSTSYGGRIVSVAPSTAPALVLDAASGTNTSINFYNAATIKWTNQVLTTGEFRWFDFTANAARLIIDSSGNLGIGTTSPIAKLDISGISTTQNGLRLTATSGGQALAAFTADTSTGEIRIGGTVAAAGNYFPVFYAAGSERARIDTSGNLGIGGTSTGSRLYVTATNPTATFKATTTGYPYAAFVNDGGDFYVGRDNSAGGAFGYAYANVIWGSGAQSTVFGTNNLVRMTLDASGNLGIGTTSPGYKLDVLGNVNRFAGASVDGIFLSTVAATDTSFYGANYFNNNGTEGVNASGRASWRIATLTAGSPTFSIGYRAPSAGAGVFSTPLTIDASGNLLVGKTSTSATSGAGVQAHATGYVNAVTASSTSAFSTYELYSTGASAYRFFVDAAGTVYATSATISALSDQRHKENVRNLNVGLSEIMALKPRLYDWKEGKGAGIKNARGFIAQEFEEVFPDLIDEWKDPAPEGEEPYKSVRQDLIPVLVKAIQEQQALITTLTARITALESA
jgi:hypothetical protein